MQGLLRESAPIALCTVGLAPVLPAGQHQPYWDLSIRGFLEALDPSPWHSLPFPKEKRVLGSLQAATLWEAPSPAHTVSVFSCFPLREGQANSEGGHPRSAAAEDSCGQGKK
jgi:hypothetical protein